jgi:hypothetical protein
MELGSEGEDGSAEVAEAVFVEQWVFLAMKTVEKWRSSSRLS